MTWIGVLTALGAVRARNCLDKVAHVSDALTYVGYAGEFGWFHPSI